MFQKSNSLAIYKSLFTFNDLAENIRNSLFSLISKSSLS